jgi:DNA repair exonuclease SbcCD ATPase subunit
MVDGISSASNLRTSLERIKALRDVAVSDLAKVKSDITRLDADVVVLIAVETFIRQLIDLEVTIGVQAVEQLQTEGLQAVFDDQDIRIKAQVEIQRGKVSVDLVTIQKYANGMEVEGLSNDSFGGSVSTVQSVLLRLIIMMRWGLRPILLLDESLPAFDANYVTNMGHFLSTLCKRLDMDILLVSHNPAMVEAADKAYRISKHNGHAKFDVVK